MPANLSQWNSTNEGQDVLSITYIPNQATQDLVSEQDILQIFSWRIINVELRETAKRQLQSPDDQESQNRTLSEVKVKRITVQMEWSEPGYVSQTKDRDSIKITLLPQMFNQEPDLIVTNSHDGKTKLEFDYKVKQQLTQELVVVIETT